MIIFDGHKNVCIYNYILNIQANQCKFIICFIGLYNNMQIDPITKVLCCRNVNEMIG